MKCLLLTSALLVVYLMVHSSHAQIRPISPWDGSFGTGGDGTDGTGTGDQGDQSQGDSVDDDKGIIVATARISNIDYAEDPNYEDYKGQAEQAIEESEKVEKTNVNPPRTRADNAADESVGGDFPAEITALNNELVTKPEELVDNDADLTVSGKSRSADKIDSPATAPEDSTDDALMVGLSEEYTKKFWYYPPAPVRCAGQLFDPLRYFCCNGKLHWKNFYYKYIKYNNMPYADACCSGVPFNSQVKICCNDKLFYIGEIGQPGHIGCCADQAYNKRKQLCCNKMLFDNDQTLKCCGYEVYRERDALCCKGVIVPRRGNQAIECCGSNSYNPASQRCCNGNPLKRNNNERCIGGAVYDANTQISCGGKIYSKRRYNSCTPGVSGNRPYRSPDQMNCGGKVYSRIFGQTVGDRGTGCCSCYMNGKFVSKIFNLRTQRCCGCKVYNIPSPTYTSCSCHYLYYYFNRIYPYFPYYYYYPRPYYYHHVYPTCRLMDPNAHSTCNGNIFPKFKSYQKCCNKARYDERFQICCSGQVRQRASQYTTCCGTETYNYKEHTCCFNHVLKIIDGKNKCCGFEMYNRNTHSCCKGLVVKGGTNHLCCGNKAWNGASYGCCEGKPFYKPKYSCCNGVVATGGGSRRRCCGTKTIDRYTQTCCGLTTPHANLQYPAVISCCGTSSFDSTTAVCCHDTETIHQKPRGDTGSYQCCYNTIYKSGRGKKCCRGEIVSTSYTCPVY
ncbi:unnamed protein product [Owenia fusiformis]|uniref:Galaxin-like repeats domain-containing protein n=1 Tax=Owenia fusiformis TaxID=6347 RepID=A0A8S4PL34_OWEFU|nr:unnamed protein product [Owenia fusiformis]